MDAMTNEIDSGVSTPRRVAVIPNDAARLVKVASVYETPGVDWKYYNTVYQLLDFNEHWPNGMSMHIGWQDEGFWSHVGLWNNGETVERYFGEVAIERISRAIQILGAIPNRDGASDVEPERYEVVNFILGPHSRRFVDIGADREGAAVNVLGGHPHVMQLTIAGFTPAMYAELIDRLDYQHQIPAELIAHYAMHMGDDIRIVEVWSGHGHALATLGEQMLPQVEHIAQQHLIDLPCDHTTKEIRRLSMSDEIVTAFGF